MNFDYYYGDESNQFAFYRIPRQLITGEAFKKLSTDAKLLYGLLLDRMGLSAKNGWYDVMGRVLIFYTLDEIQEVLKASLSGSSRGRATPLRSMSNASPPAPYRRNPLRRKTFPDFRFSEVKTSEKQKSRVPKNRSQDFRLSEVQTSENRTQVILSLIRLISVSFIHLSIHLPQSRRADG